MPAIGPDGDTRLGGTRYDFPSTCWSRLLGQAGDPSSRQKALEELSRLYWKPIYAYIRSAWAKSNEEAKDLAQDFFLWMMESDFLGRSDPLRGRFRGFVKVALKNYLVNDEERRRTLKRGGDRIVMTLDPTLNDEPAAPGGDPEQALDETWKSGLILRTTELLEEALTREGRETTFKIFRDYHLSGASALDYRALGARYGLGEQDIDNHLRLAKKRFRAIMADFVAETVDSEEELAGEWASLFGRERR